MILNESPVKTSKNYGINNFEIPDSIFENVKLMPFSNFICENVEIQEKDLKTDKNLNLYKKIEIKKDTQKPIVLNFDLDTDLVGKVDLSVFKGVNAKIIINFKSLKKVLNNISLRFFVNESANVEIVLVSMLENNSVNILKIESEVLKNAKYKINIVDFGSEYSVWNCSSLLKGEMAGSFFKMAYLGFDNNKLDYNFVKKIYGKNCKCEIEAVGALFDKSIKNFKGTLDFCKGCKKSEGNEKDFCILMSNEAKSKALPMLLSGEDDISGNHSTAVGRVNNKEVFYLMTRGLTKLEAIKLLIKAKFTSVLSDVFDENLKQEILRKIDEKIKYE